MKIEIPESVKRVLRCRECDELLSCGPVYLIHETSKAICGRCTQQPTQEEEETSSKSEKSGRSRNLQYEAAAKLLLFPCRFVDQGCHEKLHFSEDEPNMHELDCEFRSFICPIVASGSCDWVGSHHKLSDHCRDVHPTHFSQNPFVLPRPNLTESNLSNFLVSAFNFLFLVHLKVCVTAGKLFHSVRMFGDSELIDKFSYTVEIEGSGLNLKKLGSVLRAGILTIQEPTANSISINSLLDILGGKYNESKFTLSIHNLLRNCLNCLKNIDDVSDSQFCEECRGKVVKCKFHEKGCTFLDVNKKKCEKHEIYFCKYQTDCPFNNCRVNFVGSFIEHLASSTSCQKTKKVSINSVVHVIETDSNDNYILFLSNNIGTIICYYELSNSKLYLNLRTSLPSHELKNFKCSIKLSDPLTNHTLHLTPQIKYNCWRDWFINEKMNNFPSWKRNGIEIKINLYKNVN